MTPEPDFPDPGRPERIGALGDLVVPLVISVIVFVVVWRW